MDRNSAFLSFTDRLLNARPRVATPANNVLLFASAGDMIRALGGQDPDPAFTRLYQAAHIENANRDADAAFKHVGDHVNEMNARWRNRS